MRLYCTQWDRYQCYSVSCMRGSRHAETYPDITSSSSDMVAAYGGEMRIYIYKRLEEKCNHVSDNTKMNTVVPVKRKTLGKQSQRILFNLYQHQWHGTRQPLLGYYPGTLSCNHYSDVIMSAMVSQITGVSIVYTAACSSADQRKHQTIRVTGLCEGNSAVTTEFPAPRASDAENVSI